MEESVERAEKPWWILVGGRRRLGRALAEALAGECRLVLTSSRSWDEESGWLEELSTRTQVRTFCWDAGDPALVPTIMADLERIGGQGPVFSGALCVAGSFPETPFGTWNGPDLEAIWRLNLSFPFLVAQALSPHLVEGSCLQFLLDTSVHRPWLKRLPYSAAKAGQAALVAGLAQLLAPRVRVVGHALGVVLPEQDCDLDLLRRQTLLERLGSPEDLVRAVRYAAESPFLTGEILTLDGGRRWR